MSSYPTPLKVGVFLVESGTQFLDVVPIDMLGMLHQGYLQVVARSVGQPSLAGKGLAIEHYFINETGESLNRMTGGFKIEITVVPPPDYRPSPATQQFLQRQYKHVQAFLTVCTGCIPALFSGILDGKNATAPRGMIPMLEKEAPHVKWVEKRWVRDGKVWTSGAIANGQEMMVAFMREEFPELREATEMVLRFSDVAVRGAEYES